MSVASLATELNPARMLRTLKPKAAEPALMDPPARTKRSSLGIKMPEGTMGRIWSLLKLMVFPQNMVLGLTAIGIASGFLEGFLMARHFRTGVAILTCLMLGLFPTFLNVAAVIRQGDLYRLPLNVLFMLGFCAGYFMGYKNGYLW